MTLNIALNADLSRKVNALLKRLLTILLCIIVLTVMIFLADLRHDLVYKCKFFIYLLMVLSFTGILFSIQHPVMITLTKDACREGLKSIKKDADYEKNLTDGGWAADVKLEPYTGFAQYHLFPLLFGKQPYRVILNSDNNQRTSPRYIVEFKKGIEPRLKLTYGRFSK